MSIRLVAGAGLTCCLVVASSFWANAQVERTQVETRRKVGGTTHVRRSSVVIGATVAGRGDFSIGKVEDLVINEDGCIDYAYAEDVLEPGLIRVSEVWRDQAALNRVRTNVTSAMSEVSTDVSAVRQNVQSLALTAATKEE